MDVRPDGFTQELCHGIVRARYRESYTKPTLLEPDAVYQYTIQVNPTSNCFLPGHRLRIDISSSDFPNFDRNHNTGLTTTPTRRWLPPNRLYSTTTQGHPT